MAERAALTGVGPAFETARLTLARMHVGDGDRRRALESTTRLCARTLGVRRVGVWFFDGGMLRCEVLYDLEADEHRAGESLEMARFPTYAGALTQRRAIVAPDAASHPLTRELAAEYLAPAGIGSLLDAPLYMDGEVVGVVCHEHVGPPREWAQRDIDFASTAADMCSMLLEQAARAELEAKLRERAWRSSELHRLELLAELAGAIAHDFNNVLASVGLVAEQLARHPAEDVAWSGRALGESVEIGARLVRHLGALRERDPSDDESTTLVAAAVERLAHLLTPLMRSTATLRLELEEHTARVAVGPTHFDQLMMNLCLNAREAIDSHGTVAVRVRAPTTAEDAPGFLAIEVEDDGSGIPPEIVDRVFEPYFTTKPEGSGQGLATVARIVDGCGGRVSVDSLVGRGTRFTLFLPRAPEPSGAR